MPSTGAKVQNRPEYIEEVISHRYILLSITFQTNTIVHLKNPCLENIVDLFLIWMLNPDRPMPHPFAKGEFSGNRVHIIP